MSHAATSWAANLEGLPVGAKLILMLLSECHNGKSGRCDPSMDWLCRKTGFKPRMLLRHIAVLEEEKLVTRETESLGRAKGKKTSFILRIGAVSDGLQVHSDTRVSEYTCNIGSLDVHHSTRAYKEEPERTGNNTSERLDNAFESIWSAWSSVGRGRSKSKANCKAVLKRLSKASDVEAITRAALHYAKLTDGAYHKGLHTWLTGGFWEQWVPKSLEQQSTFTREDWAAAMRQFVDAGEWPIPDISPAPGHDGCKVPQDMLDAWAKHYSTKEKAA